MMAAYNATEQLRLVIADAMRSLSWIEQGSPREFVMIRLRDVAIGGVASIALAAAPVNSAFARHRGGPVFWPFALGAAVVTGAAIIATAPLRALAAPVYRPPPAYYPPAPPTTRRPRPIIRRRVIIAPPGYYRPPPA